MLREFARDSVLYGSGSVLVRGISLLLVPIYTRVLAPSDYGAIDILGVFASLVAVSVALEVTQGLARHLPDSETRAERVGYASGALWFTVGAYTIFLAISLPLAPRLGELLLEGAGQATMIQVALVAMWGNGVFSLLQNQLRWDLKPKLYTVASLVYSIVSIGVSVALVVVVRLGVAGVFWGQVVGAAAGIAAALYFTRNNFRWHVDVTKVLTMLRFSVPLVPSSLGVIIALYVDRIAIRELMTLADVGVFGIGYRLASSVSLLMVGFQAALTPIIYTRHRRDETPGELARIFRLFVALALLVVLAVSLFAREAVAVLTTPDYYEGAVVVPLLAPALLLNAMYIFAPGLAIAKRTGPIALINLFGAVTNTALNFTLIPLFGIRGAALATLLSSAGVFTAYMMTSQRAYPVPHRWRPLAAGAIIAIAMFALGSQLDFGWWPNIAIKLGLLALAGAAFVDIGLVEASEVKRVWQFVRLRGAS